ncbi:glycosyltransferase [Photobacterium damselae]|uniref:glycosyltransferase n=1 Tax=Photobacterium damselae TaxID=38293 RepID=UPI0010FE5151|nr:glycosyltransferase [Photobacterium damselae]TLS77476.1 glycosyltransferase family 4 protein [Photobacterium damselae subsp. damselae]TLS89799.1 glycosyltransferase family 4 protein [Photobacterium damselae subsp. damselae]
MKLLIITEHLDQYGGVCSSIVNLSNSLSNKIDVDIITRELNFRRDIKFKLYDEVGFLSFGSPKNSSMKIVSKIINWLKFGFYLRSISHKYNFFYSNGIILNLISLIFLYDKKVIVCDHSNFFFSRRILRILRFIFYRNAFKVLALTKDAEKEYYKIGCLTALIPNSIDCNKDSSFELIKTAVVVGRLDDNKQVDHAIKAWINVFRNEGEWKLIIYGDGKNLNKLIALARGRKDIIFKGNESNKNIIYNCSLIILTSKSEGLPMVLLEAQSYGIPIISYNCKSGPRDIVKNGSGILVKPDDIFDLSCTIEKLVNNEDILKRMSYFSMSNRYRYSHEQILNKWIEILNNKIMSKK